MSFFSSVFFIAVAVPIHHIHYYVVCVQLFLSVGFEIQLFKWSYAQNDSKYLILFIVGLLFLYLDGGVQKKINKIKYLLLGDGICIISNGTYVLILTATESFHFFLQKAYEFVIQTNNTNSFKNVCVCGNRNSFCTASSLSSVCFIHFSFIIYPHIQIPTFVLCTKKKNVFSSFFYKW